jgi:serine protease Do
MRFAAFLSARCGPVRCWVVSPVFALFLVTQVAQAATTSPGPHQAGPNQAGPTQVDPRTTASAMALGRAFSEVAEALRPTVVFIRKESRRSGFAGSSFRGPMPTATSTGTGFIVREDGYLVTNHHVVAGARQLFVQLYDRREYRATVVGLDPLTDLAVLKIDERNLPIAELGDSDGVRVGHWVIAIGNPLGRALSFSVTAGIVSATERALKGGRRGPRSTLDFIQTDAVANSGNSGGPLIDLEGKIIGVNAAIFSTTGSYQGYTLAIPSNLVAPVVERLIGGGRVMRAGLGVSVEDATVEDAIAVGLESVRGVVVQDVTVGGGRARRAGLREGDVIVALDGKPITSSAQLQRSVWFRWAGDSVRVAIRREDGVERSLRVPLQWLSSDSADFDEGQEDGVVPPCSDNPLGLCLVETVPAGGGSGGSSRSGEEAGKARSPKGLFVRAVYQVGPSFGKLRPEVDVITHVNGTRVRSLAELEAVLSDCMAGQIVAVRTVRPRTGERGFTRVRLQG